MENLNTERKPLSELIKEAEEKNMTLVLVVDPETTGNGHHRVEAFIKMDKFMVVRTTNLPESDNETVAKMLSESKPFPKKDPFAPEPIPFKNYHLDELPDNIVLKENGTLHHEVPLNLKINDLNKRVLPNIGQMKKNMLRSHRRK